MLLAESRELLCRNRYCVKIQTGIFALVNFAENISQITSSLS